MNITITPEDKTAPEKFSVDLHPDLIRRLNAYAASLNSSPRHVVTQMFDQVLPKIKKGKKANGASA